MELSHEQISSITRGAVSFHTAGDALKIFRFSDTQLSVLQKLNPGFRTNGCHTAGVCFDFLTDSSFFSLSWLKEPNASRNRFSIDIYINGVMHDTYGSECFAEEITDHCHFMLPKGEKRITVHFPYAVQLIPTHVTLDKGASLTPVRPSRRILTIGDSITQGYHARYTSQSYASSIARYFDFDQINWGVNGAFAAAAALEPIDGWTPDVITTAFGTNDWGHYHSLHELEKENRAFFDRISDLWPDTPVLAILPIWRNDVEKIRSTGNLYTVCEKLREIIKGYPNIRILDGMDAVPHNVLFYGDAHAHPNDMGFSHYTLAVIRALSEML